MKWYNYVHAAMTQLNSTQISVAYFSSNVNQIAAVSCRLMHGWSSLELKRVELWRPNSDQFTAEFAIIVLTTRTKVFLSGNQKAPLLGKQRALNGKVTVKNF